MPRGTIHEYSGRLNQQDGAFILRLDGGGTWRLDIAGRNHRRASVLVGRQVLIDGVRDGFDLLSVNSIAEVPSG